MAPLVKQYPYEPRARHLTPEQPSDDLVGSLLAADGPSVNVSKDASEQRTHTSEWEAQGLLIVEEGQPRRRDSHSPLKEMPKKDTSSGLRFMVVEHPDQLKDKNQMRKNRIHVMQNYLAKEAQNPDSKDSRVHGNSKVRGKRKKPRQLTPPVLPGSRNVSGSPSSNILRQDPARLTSAESVQSTSSRETPEQETDQTRAKSFKSSTSNRRQDYHTAADRWQSPSELDRRGPLVKGIGGYFENSRYMRAAIDDIPFSFRPTRPGDHVAAPLQPFGSWPTFSDPGIDVYELKWKCSQRFGSTSLGTNWIPLLLRARHAFLSTLCISSAHDDIMTRSFLPPHLHNGDSLAKRWKVRSGVIEMINESLSDPELKTADETIIAVLHILNSEIMGCNDESMRIHQSGLHAMVKERGGLEKLGAGGQLAFVLTITNYMIAVMRECTPHRDYIEFASKQDTKIPHDAVRLPESPIYSRPQGFENITAACGVTSPIYELLNSLRIMTKCFYIENSQRSPDMPSQFRTARFWEQPDETVSTLYGKVFAVKPAAEQDFHSMGERYMFEAVRLTSLVYAHALANKISFSKAATQVRSSSVAADGKAEPEPMPIQIKNALMRTDVSYCWDHLAGVLFWITLVAGAAANPGPLANEDRVGVDEDARKWITAISVRCCIVLSFEYGPSVLETLKRMLAIETVLERTETTDNNAARASDGAEINASGDHTFGPSEPPPMQRGFADFAQEFLSI